MDLILAALCSILGIEIVFRKLYDKISSTKHHGETYYSWSFVSPQGIPISNLKGDLKLSIHPFTVYSNAPNQKTDQFSINANGIRTNGGIDPDNIPPSQRRILILGGSTAFGTGLNSNTETYAAHISRILKNVCVLNAGVIGFISGQELVQLITDLVVYNPHLVITLDGFNDLFIQLRKAKDWPGKGANEFEGLISRLVALYKIETSMFYGFLHCFRGIYSFLLTIYRIIKNVSGIILGKTLKTYIQSYMPFISVKEEMKESNLMTFEDIVEEYTSNLAKITRIGKGFGFKHLAVMQPALLSDRENFTPNGRFHFSKEQINLYESFLESAMKRLQELNVEHYCAHYDFKTNHSLFLDDIHLTSKGFNKLAFTTVNILKQKEMI
ncbi:MAG: SGNH/GDSL hydrolase family protein [bacterium]